MILCSRAQRIKADYESAYEGFMRQARTCEQRGDLGRAAATVFQAKGSQLAMAKRLNYHMQNCKECGP